MDRIDLRVQVFSVDPYTTEESESSEEIRKRVERAIDKQMERYKGVEGVMRNAQINYSHVKRNVINVSPTATRTAKMIYDQYRLNMRTYVRLHAVARTIADTKNRNEILEDDIVRAHQVMGKKSSELFDLTRAVADIETAPKKEGKRARDALRVLAKAVGDEMLLGNYTLQGLSRESGVSKTTIRSIFRPL